MKKQRKHYTPEEKVAILRWHLLEQVPISELCDKQGLQPTVFYRWQKEFFENGAAAFQPKARPNHSRRAGADRLSGEEDPDRCLYYSVILSDQSIAPAFRGTGPLGS